MKLKIDCIEKYPHYILQDRKHATKYGWEEDTGRELTQDEKDVIFDKEATEFTDAEVAIVNLYNAACNEFDVLIQRKHAENMGGEDREEGQLVRDSW
jgi:hypothetical protein